MLDKKLDENEKNLLISLIYFIMATHKERTLDYVLILLQYDKRTVKDTFILSGLGEKSQAMIYFNKLKDLLYLDYDTISNRLRKKVEKSKKIDNAFPSILEKAGVDIYAEKIVNQYNGTMKEYVKKLIGQKDSRGFFIEGLINFYDYKNADNKGLSMIQDSVAMNNSLALYHLGKIYFEGHLIRKNYIKAEQLLKELIDKEKRK